MRQDAVTRVIEDTVSDILFLGDLNEVGPFLRNQVSATREAVEREFVAFARNRGTYDQIRLLSPDGMELLRVNHNGGQARAVAQDELQHKGERSYFQEMLQCSANTVYVSSLDLNMEHGSIESPLNPVMRFAIHIGETASPAGYLLLNLSGSSLLDAFANSHPDVEASPLLINQDGDFTYGLTSSDGWQFMLLRQTGQAFLDLFPEEWKTIALTKAGQFETSAGLFTYTALTPYEAAGVALCEMTGSEQALEMQGAHSYDVWKNVSWVPSQMLSSVRMSGAWQLAGWNAFGVLLLGTVSWIFARWLALRGEKQRLTAQTNTLLESTLQRYMSKEVCNRLLDDPQRHGQLGGDAQFVAVLFVDIRGFTGFCEQRDPKHVVAVLNRTLTELVVPLRVYRGILDKYVGDGFLAFFEPEHDEADAAQRAVDAAIVMLQAFANLWKHAPSPDLRSLGLGIGISVGRVIVGNVGTRDSMDYTIVGDAVNVASRLEGLAKNGEILISDRVSTLLNDVHDAEHLGPTKLKGRQEPIDVYRLGHTEVPRM
jgi:class 3 adenylate cyclase